jgi:hypothetical protein
MTISNFRATEALYIVIVRDRDAERLLREWAKTCRVQVTIENNRIKIFEQQTLNLFQLSWPGSLDSVTIWDCWNKRHIYLD